MRGYNLKKNKELITNGDISTLLNFTFKNGRSFPNSYIDFVKKYGYGLSSNLFIIYIPMKNYSDSIFVRSEEIVSTYKDVLNDKEELWFDLGSDLKYEDLVNLFPFGISENGHYLFWDIMSGGKDNEMKIYLTDFRSTGFIEVAQNLYDFFKKVTSESHFKEALPFSCEPLPKTFLIYDRTI